MGHQGMGKGQSVQQDTETVRMTWFEEGLRKVNLVPVVSTGEGPRKLRFPLQSIESSGFNEVKQIDHLKWCKKICMTATGYNQVLVTTDHFTKYAEVAPCITASAEET